MESDERVYCTITKQTKQRAASVQIDDAIVVGGARCQVVIRVHNN